MPPSEQAPGFTEEVTPPEPALRAYLPVRFPSRPDFNDIVQESYPRLFRAQVEGPNQFRFATRYQKTP